MGRQRVASPEGPQAAQQPQTSDQTTTEEEVAALVAAILAGSVSIPIPTLAIAEALLNLVPGFLPTPVQVRISADVARMVSEVGTNTQRPSGASLAAQRGNLAYRALYAVQAVKRLVKAVSGPSEEPVEERLERAFNAERSYLLAHLNASRRREQQGAVLDALANAYGPILSWNHRDIGRSHRPSHLKADGANFDIRQVPTSTEGFPGFLPGCHCFGGPPIPNARVIT